MKFFEDFVCVPQMILLTKLKILMSVLGLNSKDRKSTRDKANISNPKVNRGCVPLTTNCISADCLQISLGPSIPYIPLGVYHTGGFNPMLCSVMIICPLALNWLTNGPNSGPVWNAYLWNHHTHFIQIRITLKVRVQSYLGLTRSISWFLMPWLLTSPGHQQPWYWLCRIGMPWSYLRKDFNYLCHMNVEEWHKL